MYETTALKNKTTAFEKGLGMLRDKDRVIARREIIIALGIRDRTMLYKRKKGIIALNPAEQIALIGIFEKYGVSQKQIWGLAEKSHSGKIKMWGGK